MIMLSEKYGQLIKMYPEEKSLVIKLQQLVEDSSSRSEFSINRLIDKLEPNSVYILPQVLTSAVECHVLTRVFRVLSPSLIGLEDYDSITEVPSEIYDYTEGETLMITPENIELIYKPYTD